MDTANVFIKHLPSSINDKELYNLFKNFGKIINYKVMLDKKKNSLGFGFVLYDSLESAMNAIQVMNGYKINKKKLLCELSKKPKKEKNTNLYISSLDETIKECNYLLLFNISSGYCKCIFNIWKVKKC